jgi:hypothetical protein
LCGIAGASRSNQGFHTKAACFLLSLTFCRLVIGCIYTHVLLPLSTLHETRAGDFWLFSCTGAFFPLEAFLALIALFAIQLVLRVVPRRAAWPPSPFLYCFCRQPVTLSSAEGPRFYVRVSVPRSTANMDALAAVPAANSAGSRFPRRSRTIVEEWKTLQCVTAPKILSIVGQKKQFRAPADTSGFVLVKFQVVSVAPEDRPPQVEAAAHTLQEMASGAVQRPTSLEFVEPTSYLRDALPHVAGLQNRAGAPGRHVRRNEKYESVAQPCMDDDGGSSSAGSGPRDLHQCHFPGCSKVCVSDQSDLWKLSFYVARR